MKRTILGVIIVMMMFVTGGCAKRGTLLSDEELATVFHDAFLSNAYATNLGLKLDSLRLYDQIFAKYGYTAADVQYTIGNFSKRKSARLGDVVERAIEMLEQEGKLLDASVTVLDSIDKIVQRRTTRTIYSDSLIEFRVKSDTVALRIEIDDILPGDYTIDFDYRVDSLDTYKKRYFAQYWFEIEADDDSTSTKESRSAINTITLAKNQVQHIHRRTMAHGSATSLVIRLADFDAKEEKIDHHVTFKNLVVRHIPSVADAHDILFEELTNVIIFGDEGLVDTSKNSL